MSAVQAERLRSGRRIRARRSRGFTLLELMVVVLLVAILAMIAAPGMADAQRDRKAYDYARQYVSLIHRAPMRATARGAAHLVLVDTSASTRGRAFLFEAVDTTAAAQGGPRPWGSCKSANWADAAAFAPGTAQPAGTQAPFVDGVNVGDVSTAGINADMHLSTALLMTPAATGTVAAICYSPGGNVFVGTGSDAAGAITSMISQLPFANVLELDVARHTADGATATIVGLTRRIVVAGGAPPRIISQ